MSAMRRDTGVTAPAGFLGSGIRCGIRADHTDLALLVSERAASAAAVFTRNLVQAAPVVLSRLALESSGGRAQAIVVNSGNANACTGEQGDRAARRSAEALASLLDLPTDHVLVASTGVIGQQLPVDRLIDELPRAVAALSVEGGEDAAEAILTTDTCRKECVQRVDDPAGAYTIGGMVKGSGMIHPDLATTLAFVTTDAAVPAAVLRPILRRAADRSFNRLTVDGDTSTNDMIAVLANGAAGVEPGTEGFEKALTEVLVELTRAVARDGEGATRLITVRVTGGATEPEALAVARTVAGSLLVKTAVHGADANWGRIAAAAGRSGVDLRPEALTVRINGLRVLSPGFVSDYSEDEAGARLAQEEVVLEVDLGAGAAEATTWTCDLTAGYIDINANYRT
ncbi:MAG: bifunctional glutamate N-acetyltransferase/amino-acid acetyltransferase ArgJ [Thermoanaerobaculia bacterium]